MTNKQKLNNLIMKIAESFHTHVAALYISKRGDVSFGTGGQFEIEWCYAKSYGHPARWKNAGVRIAQRDRRQTIIIENYRAREVATIPLKLIPKNAKFEGLLYGDLFAVPTDKADVFQRYAPVFGKGKDKTKIIDFKPTGLAVKMLNTKLETYYEHGQTIFECLRENKRKLDIARQNDEKPVSPQEARAYRLASKLVKNLTITRETVRATGACEAGIKAWLKARKINADKKALKLTQIKRADRNAPFLSKAIKTTLLTTLREHRAQKHNAT